MNKNKHSVASGPAILQVVPSLNSGGAERSTLDIAAALAGEGFAPLVASAGGRMVAELEAKGGEWIEMPLDSKSPVLLIANAVRLHNLIRMRNVKLVHARSRATAWSAFVASRRTGVPFVTTYHGAYSTASRLKRFVNSVMLRGDAVIANSDWTAQQIRTQYAIAPRKLVTIRRGIDFGRFDPAAIPPGRIAAQRHFWNANAEDVIVLLPGRLSRRKGQLVAVDAFAQIASEGNLGPLRLVLAGEGGDAYAAEVRQLAKRHRLEHAVRIAGHVEDMPAAYLAADIVVSASSKPEAFGRVAAEAGAMGRPVIAADEGGAREIVLPGISGHLVAPGDSRALAQALANVLAAGSATRASMGAEGRAHVLSHFALARMAAQTIGLYRDLLGLHTPA